MIFQTHLHVLNHVSYDTGEFFNCFVTLCDKVSVYRQKP